MPPRNYLLPGEDPDAFEDPAVADEFDESLLDGEFDEEEERDARISFQRNGDV
jgi:hypothetical protein